jgi:ankyrin repeat protein
MCHVAELGGTCAQSTPFLYAATKGHEAVLVLLKERGADVMHTDATGNTALFWAAQTKGRGRLPLS